MRKLYLILACLLVLGVVLSGCVGKKPSEQTQQKPNSQAAGIEGNISVPGENDLPIEDIQTSHDENVDMGGVSHLLEHMAFKGTERRSARDIAVEIEAVGGHLNAYTSRENTAYFAKVLKEDLGLAMDIIADIVQNPAFDKEELERERAVIIQEINQANDTPDDLVFDFFQETAYPDQALGRPVLGTVDSVKNMTRETIRQYMRANYVAPSMVLAATGNLDHEQVVEMAANAFGNLPVQSEAKGQAACYVGGERRHKKDLEQVQLVMGFDGVDFKDPDFHAASVLSTLFGGGMSSRLFQEIREKYGLVYSIYSFLSCYLDGGMFGIYAGTGKKEGKRLVPLICDEILKICDRVDEDEVARARAQIKAGILMSLESTTQRCEQLARQMAVYGRPLSVEEVVEKVEAVDPAAIVRVARRLCSSKLNFAALGPIGKIEPYQKTVERLAG